MGTVTITPGLGEEIIKKMIDESGTSADVGFFDSAYYEDGTSVALVAATQEYGSPKLRIPPRSFMRSTMDEETLAWKKIVTDGMQRVSEGKLTIYDVMEGVGGQAAGDCRKKIASIYDPPISDRTKEARARARNVPVEDVNDKPLVDTRVMITHLTHRTVKE